jgi:hypothetical protein
MLPKWISRSARPPLPKKPSKRLFLWYMDFDAVERNPALKHNRSSSFTELYLRESHNGEL